MRALQITFLASAAVGAYAQISIDFSNNLATDLGPLLALFGENITKQYLSESIFVLDYVIFALAPIGILTILISVIRVCGSPSLRAFIGRAQEGYGLIEAELCSSTSQDVCELFNDGGITRVMGKPKILELIYVPHQATDGDPAGSIDLLSSYLGNRCVANRGDWIQTSRSNALFPPHPNLTLNVGIKRPHKAFLYAVAVAGFLLQGTVLIVAGLGAFRFEWLLHMKSTENENEKGGNLLALKDSAFTFIMGTLGMSLGAFMCAALIGRSTSETTYKRRINAEEKRKSQITWIQPGNQIIGDQTFDAFAYTESTENIMEYHFSTKLPSAPLFSLPSESATVVAVLITLGGYITQFIGLRGLGPWIAIGQIAITLIMSILRGLLRPRRMRKGQNDLAHFFKDKPDLSGHTLDWLAFNFDERSKLVHNQQWFLSGDRSVLRQGKKIKEGCLVSEILKHRTKLAFLTSIPTATIHEAWTDEQVAVRIKARQLSDAICRTAATLFSEAREHSTEVRLPISMGRKLSEPSFTTLHVKKELQTEDWVVSVPRIEAILSLWLWSFKTREQSLMHLSNEYWIVAAHATANLQVEYQAILSLWDKEKLLNVKCNKLLLQHESEYNSFTVWGRAGFWSSGPLHPIYSEPTHRGTSGDDLSRFYGWVSVLNRIDSRNVSQDILPSATIPAKVPEPKTSSTPAANDAAGPSISVTYIRRRNKDNVLTQITQELYSLFVSAMAAGVKEIGSVGATHAFDGLRLTNHTISTLQDIFNHREINLGSRSDALQCIIPSLKSLIDRAIDPSVLLPLVNTRADEARKIGNKVFIAEGYLQYVCNLCQNRLSLCTGDERKEALALFRSALISTGEYFCHFYYRGSVRTKLAEALPLISIRFLAEKFHEPSFPKDTGEDSCAAVVLRYIALTIRCAQDHGNEDSLPAVIRDDMINPEKSPWAPQLAELDLPIDQSSFDVYRQHNSALLKRKSSHAEKYLQFSFSVKCKLRIRALYFLNMLDARDFHHGPRHDLPLAASYGWEEVVKSLLEFRVPADARDAQGRTAMLQSAIVGNIAQFETLVRYGANPLLVDEAKNGCLLHAAQNGHLEFVQHLLAMPNVKVNGHPEAQLTPLGAAVIRNHTDIVRLLLEAPGIEPLRKTLVTGGAYTNTPFRDAVNMGYEEVVRLFVEGDHMKQSIDFIDVVTNPNEENEDMIKFALKTAGYREIPKELPADVVDGLDANGVFVLAYQF